MPYKNPELQKEAKRRWYENNKALTAKRTKAWKKKKKNKAKIAASGKIYRAKNRERIRTYQNNYEREQSAKLTDYYIIQELKKYGIPSTFSRKYPAIVQMMKGYYGLVRLTKKKNTDGKKEVTIHSGKQLHRLLKRY